MRKLTSDFCALNADFGRFISFIGSTCCTLLGFVLPTLFYVRIFEADGLSPVHWGKKMVLYAIMLVGLAAFGAGVYDALAGMF